MNASPYMTLHLTLWQEFTKKSFIIQLIVVIFLVNYCMPVIATPPLFVLWKLVPIIGVSLLLFRPIYALFVIIFFVAGFLSSDLLPSFRFYGIGSVQTTDAILGGLFLMIIVQKLYYRFFYRHHYPIIRTPIDIPLILFLIACVIALINGIVIQKADFNIAFRTFRMTSSYLLFFLITNLIRNKKDLTLFIGGVFSIAVLTALVSCMQQIPGASALLPFIGRVETLQTQGTIYTGVTRAIPGGIFLVYLSFVSLGCIVITRRFEGKTILLAISVIMLGLGLLFSFYRVTWITSFFALLLFIFLAPIQQKGRFIIYFFAAICMVILISLYSLSSSSKISKIFYATQDRITSVFRVKGVKGQKADTLNPRTKEVEYALLRIKDHPILGIGLGTFYKPLKIPWYFFLGGASETKQGQTLKENPKLEERLVRALQARSSKGSSKDLFTALGEKDVSTKAQTEEGKKKVQAVGLVFWGILTKPSDVRKLYIPNFHNSFLDIIMRLGLLGSLPFFWLTALCLTRGFLHWKNVQDPFLGVLCVGLTLANVGIFINALTDPILLNPRGIIPISIIWGINEVIYRVEGIEDKK